MWKRIEKSFLEQKHFLVRRKQQLLKSNKQQLHQYQSSKLWSLPFPGKQSTKKWTKNNSVVEKKEEKKFEKVAWSVTTKQEVNSGTATRLIKLIYQEKRKEIGVTFWSQIFCKKFGMFSRPNFYMKSLSTQFFLKNIMKDFVRYLLHTETK